MACSLAVDCRAGEQALLIVERTRLYVSRRCSNNFAVGNGHHGRPTPTTYMASKPREFSALALWVVVGRTGVVRLAYVRQRFLSHGYRTLGHGRIDHDHSDYPPAEQTPANQPISKAACRRAATVWRIPADEVRNLKTVRVAVLLFGLTGIAALVMTWGSQHNTTPNHPNHVAHPHGTMLSVTFAHADHVNQQCIECHHNYVDDTGTGLCFDCHKTDPQVADLIETQFHTLCRDCHIKEARRVNSSAYDGAKTLTSDGHGPLRACASCHRPDNRP